jgi:hypothetical protein
MSHKRKPVRVSKDEPYRVADRLSLVQLSPIVKQARKLSNYKKFDKPRKKTKFSSGTWKIDNCIF